MEKVKTRIIGPTIKGLKVSGIRYQGFIFFGLINVKGEPFVIEYNVRLGDPESEVVIPRIKSDLLDLFIATAEGRLNEKQIDISDESATTVMLVSAGYPGETNQNRKRPPRGAALFMKRHSIIQQSPFAWFEQSYLPSGYRNRRLDPDYWFPGYRYVYLQASYLYLLS